MSYAVKRFNRPFSDRVKVLKTSYRIFGIPLAPPDEAEGHLCPMGLAADPRGEITYKSTCAVLSETVLLLVSPGPFLFP